MSYTSGQPTNGKSMNGIIAFDDGNGGILEDGVLSADHSNTTTSEVDNITIDNQLNLVGSIYANALTITPTWVSYLFGLTGNIQTQISSIISTILSSNNIWTGSQTFSNNQVNTEFIGSTNSLPSFGSAQRGAIYGYGNNPRGLTFMNNHNSTTASHQAFSWYKMFNSGSAIELMNITNAGDLTVIGSMASPTITTMQNNISSNTTAILNNAYDITTKQNIITSSNRLNADLIGTGIISNTEYNYLDGVTSNIQTQIDTKLNSNNGVCTGVLSISNSGSSLPLFGSSTVFGGIGTNLSSGNAELSFINTGFNVGIPTARAFNWYIMTSETTKNELMLLRNNGDLIVVGNISSPTITDLQTQITTNTTDITTKQNTITSSNRLNADLIGTGIVSNTEYNYLDGVTSAIQTQLNTKAGLSSDNTFTGTNTLNRIIVSPIYLASSIAYTAANLPSYINTFDNSISITIPGAEDFTKGFIFTVFNASANTSHTTIIYFGGVGVRYNVNTWPAAAGSITTATSVTLGPSQCIRMIANNPYWSVI